MKSSVLTSATLSLLLALSLGITACDRPEEQDEPEQPPPDAEATMQRSPDAQPVGVETGSETEPVETTASKLGEQETAAEDEPEEEADPPPPQNRS